MNNPSLHVCQSNRLYQTIVRLVCIMLCLMTSYAIAQSNPEGVITVQAGDTAGLIDAINQANQRNDFTIVEIAPADDGSLVFEIPGAFGSSSNALPVIVGDVRLVPAFNVQGQIIIRATGTDFRFAEIAGSGNLSFRDLTIEGFSNPGSGGVFLAGDTSTLRIGNSTIRDNFSSQEGGAIFAQDNAKVVVIEGRLERNRASNLGGGISLTGMSRGSVIQTTFSDNQAGVFGCDVNFNSSFMSANDAGLLLVSNVFTGGNCQNVKIENPRGSVLMGNNQADGSGDVIDSTSLVELFGNLFGIDRPSAPQALKAACNDFGSGAFMSAGYNLNNGDDCFATDPTDLVNTDPMLTAPDSDGIRALQPGSPAIDAGAVGLQNLMRPYDVLPCGYKDVRGLGRPQDANLDGIYECDIGVFEVQGGPDIGAPQSALYFDPARNGEGTSVEILPGGQAFVAQFTYRMDGSGPAWFAGVGEVVGNSVVVDSMQQPQGGVFGAGFDNDLITRPVAGSTSLVFSNCAANASSAGIQSFQASDEVGFEDVQVGAVRLSTVVDCQSSATATSGRSGSFFSPARDGEGIIVEWLANGNVVIIWYTYDPQGNQFWMISGETTVTGNSVTANMLYPAQSTAFGSQFDPAEIVLQPWGTVTLTYNPGCNGLSFDFASTVNGFGSGQYDYSRLTSLDGTSCDL